MTRFLVIGNPENRRVSSFVDALKNLRQPTPVVVPHLQLLRNPSLLHQYANEAFCVRLESVGENRDVEYMLLQNGLEQATKLNVSTTRDYNVRHGEVVCPRQFHLGYTTYLAALQQQFEQIPHWRILNSPADVMTLFDKRKLMSIYHRAAIPVPEALSFETPVKHTDELRALMNTRGWRKVFVKLTCGSSASCLAVFMREPGSEMLMTTLLYHQGTWWNSLKLQRLSERSDIERVLNFLLREGSHIERAIPKARLSGAFMDCRVLVADGKTAFVVVRQNRHPITNLHLGGWRGDMNNLRGIVDPDVWQRAMATCRQVWRMHNSFHIGVDLMFEPGFKKFRVLEANAFGDLLPDLYADGLSVYEWQISRLA